MALAGIAARALFWGTGWCSEPLGAPSRLEGTQVMSRRGFTLIELLIVVVIIGLLAAIAIPKFSNTKEKTYVASMKSDLRNLATAEEAFFYDSSKYTKSFILLSNFSPSAGVNLQVVQATGSGWSASTTSLYAPGRLCALYSGSAAPVAPATSEGRISCQ